MKKIFSTIVIISVIFTFFIPVIFNLNIKKIEAGNDWYFTKTNDVTVNSLAGAVSFVKTTGEIDCKTQRNAIVKTNPKYTTIGPCTEKIQAPAGEGWGYNVTMTVGQVAENNPIGFKTEEDCNINRDNFLTTTYPNKKDLITGVDTCIYKKGISNNGVATPITGKQTAAGDKYDATYHLLAPIGDFKEIKTDDIGGYFDKIFLIAIGLCGALAVIMFVIGGIQYMGEESIFGKTKGKEQMTNAVLGLLIALGSLALLNTINPDLLGGSGLLISSAEITLDMKVHGDVPQTEAIDGKFCAGRAVAGAVWEDATEATNRAAVKTAGISIQRGAASCKNVGDRSCTSLSGLDTAPVINFKEKICPECAVVINGGTECWEHSPNTTHIKGTSIVDLDDTPSMTKYVEAGKKEKTSSSYYQYTTKDGTKFLDELSHYHILSWK